jgi:hypothetical protein
MITDIATAIAITWETGAVSWILVLIDAGVKKSGIRGVGIANLETEINYTHYACSDTCLENGFDGMGYNRFLKLFYITVGR